MVMTHVTGWGKGLEVGTDKKEGNTCINVNLFYDSAVCQISQTPVAAFTNMV